MIENLLKEKNIKKVELASYLGILPQNLNKELRDWRKMRYIRLKKTSELMGISVVALIIRLELKDGGSRGDDVLVE